MCLRRIRSGCLLVSPILGLYRRLMYDVIYRVDLCSDERSRPRATGSLSPETWPRAENAPTDAAVPPGRVSSVHNRKTTRY